MSGDPIKRKVVFAGEPRCELYLGDNLEILPVVGPVDTVVADPPYGVGIAEWDKVCLPPASWLSLLLARSVYVTPGNGPQVWTYPQPDWIAGWFRPGSTQYAKGGDALGGRFSHWEPVLIYGENNLRCDARMIMNEIGHREESGHPCPKPLALMRWLLSDASGGNGVVPDPFMGSGQTAIAATQLRRAFIGIEIDPGYFEIAVRRITEAREEVFNRLPFEEPTPDLQLELH